MKQRMTVFLWLCIIGLCMFALIACSNSSIKSQPSSSDKSGSETIAQSFSDVELVDITLPGSWFTQDLEAFNLEVYVEANGFKKAVKNDDNSITVTMSKEKHSAAMHDLQVKCADTLDKMVEHEDTPFIKEMSYDQNFNEIIIRIDEAEQEETVFNMSPLLAGLTGMMYQTFAGEELYVEVITVDIDSGKELGRALYPEIFQEKNSNAD